MATSPTALRASAHHGYKSWTSTWYDHEGKRRTKRFGKVDDVPRKVAVARYQSWLANEWTSASNEDGITVTGLCKSYLEYAHEIYRKRDKATTTISEVKATMEALVEQFGKLSANSLGAPDIARFRDGMIHTRRKHKYRPLDTRPLSVATLNGRLGIIKRCFGWARQYDMVDRETALDIQLVKPLISGRTKAIASEHVKPVSEAILKKTIENSVPTVADMIRVQVLTGMRSGELCSMRACDIDQTDDVWIYRPAEHKTEHHGKLRTAPIGPLAQKILAPYIAKRKLTDPVFTPEDAHRERLERNGLPLAMAYQLSRSTFKPGRFYVTETYRNAIQRECDRIWDRKGEKRAAGDYSHRWHPHQLRHNAATNIRRVLGIEAAQDVLGHAQPSMTERYSENTIERQKDIARKVG